MPAHVERTRIRPVAVAAIVLGACWILVPIWVTATRFDALLHSHPAYPVLLVLSAVIGVLVVAVAVRRLRRPGRGTRRSRILGAFGVIVLLLATLVIPGGLFASSPRSATPVAVAAMRGSAQVAVTEDSRTITLTPRENPKPVGVIFQPGALVEARGYANVMSQVARQGYPVVIVKQPLGLGFTAFGAATRIMDAHPETPRWVVAGHSLGGLPSARAAASGDPRIVGLSMWASYPDSATSVPAGVPIQLLYGTRDLLVPRTDIEPARPQLPGAEFIPIEGAIHAYFGDYGSQANDGTPTVDQATAQAHMVAALTGLLARVSAPATR